MAPRSLVLRILLLASVVAGAAAQHPPTTTGARPTPDSEIEKLISDLKSADTRSGALEELQGMKARALPALQTLLGLIDDEDGLNVAHPALRAVCEIGPQAVEAIPAILNMAVRQPDAWGVQAALDCGSVEHGFGLEGVPFWLREAVTGPRGYEDVRNEMIKHALAGLGSAGHSVLLSLLRNERDRVRIWIIVNALSMSEAKGSQWTDVLVQLSRSRRLDVNTFLRAVALLDERTKPLMDAVIKLCKSDDPSIVRAAHAALATMDQGRWGSCPQHLVEKANKGRLAR